MAFDEAGYLAANPDVALAVKNKQFGSGYEHYLSHGIGDIRPLNATAEELARVGVLRNQRDNQTRQDTFLKEQEAGRVAEQNRLRSEEEGLFRSFEQKVAGQEKLPTAYGRLETEAGIPQLRTELTGVRGQVNKVRDLLDTLEKDVTSRVSGMPVTESQRRAIYASEEAPMRNQLTKLLTGQQGLSEELGQAYTGVENKLKMVSSEQSKELQPIQMRLSAFGERAAREMTGYTTSKQSQLDVLLDQISAGRQISRDTWLQASQLASEERAFEKEKNLFRMKTDEALAAEGREWGRNKELLSIQAEIDKAKAEGDLVRAKELERFKTDEQIRQSRATKKAGDENITPEAFAKIMGFTDNSGIGQGARNWMEEANQIFDETMGGGSTGTLTKKGSNLFTGPNDALNPTVLQDYLRQRSMGGSA